MENIILKANPDSPFNPQVNFDISSGTCLIEGESYMENSFQFYSPLIEWLEFFIREIKRKISFRVKLTYFNTSSSRQILEILDILKEYTENGGEVEIIWFCIENDLDMKDEIEDFEAESGLDISVKFIAKGE